MPPQVLSEEELVDRGLRFYDERLRPQLEPHKNGQQVAVHLEDGDYEVASTTHEAVSALRQRHPHGEFLLFEVGRPVIGHGGSAIAVPSDPQAKHAFEPSGDPELDRIVRTGLEVYEHRLRPLLEPRDNGRCVVLNVENGDYALADTFSEAGAVMRAKYPDTLFFSRRVGYDSVVRR